MRRQGRPVADEPEMPEGIEEAALAMRTPRGFVIQDLVGAPVCTRGHSPGDETVGVVDEHLNAYGPCPNPARRPPVPALRLTQEQRSALHR